MQFAGLIRRMPPPTFSDTAITDRHSDTTFISNPEHTGCGYPGLLDRKKSFGHVPTVGIEPSTSYVNGEHPIHRARSSNLTNGMIFVCWTAQ